MFLSFPRVFPYEEVFLLNLKNCIPQYRQCIRLQKNGLPVISGRKQATYGPLSWLLCLLSRTRWLLHPWALKWTPAEQTTHTVYRSYRKIMAIETVQEIGIQVVHADTRAYKRSLSNACARTVDSLRLFFPSPVSFGCDSWGVFRWRVQSMAEGPSINNKQQLSCVGPSVLRATQSQAQHLRGVCPTFRLWSCLLQKLIKCGCASTPKGVCLCPSAQGSSVLYSKAGWK